jgi:hypothetical protein
MKPTNWKRVAALAVGLAWPAIAAAQDYDAMIRESQARMNAIIANAQASSNRIVEQNMRDPKVQAAYRQHLAEAQRRGVQPYDFRTYAYYYSATGGFSQQGLAQYNATTQSNQSKEQAAWRDLQAAQADRAAAQAQNSARYSANQQEAGRALQGTSSYTAPNGQQLVLPHTWQANSYHNYQGAQYFVDASGNYFVQTIGYWYPLAR